MGLARHRTVYGFLLGVFSKFFTRYDRSESLTLTKAIHYFYVTKIIHKNKKLYFSSALQIALDYLFISVTCNKLAEKQSCTNELAIWMNRRERLPFSSNVSHECQRSSTLLDKLSRPHLHQLKFTVCHATAISEIILKTYVYTNLHIIYNL